MQFKIDYQIYITLLEEKVRALQHDVFCLSTDRKKNSPHANLLNVTDDERRLADETFKAPRNLDSSSSLNSIITGKQ